MVVVIFLYFHVEPGRCLDRVKAGFSWVDTRGERVKFNEDCILGREGEWVKVKELKGVLEV